MLAEHGMPFSCRWGPPLPHRFNSFLTDPQLHPSVRASQLRLRTSPDVK